MTEKERANQLQGKAEELMGEQACLKVRNNEIFCEIVYCNHIGIQVKTDNKEDGLPFIPWGDIKDIEAYTT